jgi:trehalose 6-phosphate synthase/phosphatase
MAATFRIASSQIIKTVADHRLPSTDSVLTMLKWVERHFMRRKPRANSLTYKNTKKMDYLSMHMSFQPPSSPSSVGSNSDHDQFDQD